MRVCMSILCLCYLHDEVVSCQCRLYSLLPTFPVREHMTQNHKKIKSLIHLQYVFSSIYWLTSQWCHLPVRVSLNTLSGHFWLQGEGC